MRIGGRYTLGLALALAGCAGAPQLYEVKSVYVCAAEECGPAGQRYSANQMLRALHRLFEVNSEGEFRVCDSDPKTRHCASEGVGYFVMGGPIPGRGSQVGGAIRQPKIDPAMQNIRFTMASHLRFIGVPLACVDHPSTLTVRSADEISIADEPYYCNWVGVGNMSATFSFAVESVDFDKGRIAGYWAHAVAGVGNGRGEGYALIELEKPMPRGENWLAN
jgi:hypothetical protein